MTPVNPFSISSTHRTAGATASAMAIVLRIFSSDEPTIPPNSFPTSSLNSGQRHSAAMAFAARLLPVPGTPVINRPLGEGRPEAWAFLPITEERR